MKDKIWLSSPHMGGAELKYISEAFEENWIAPLGPHVNAVEENLSTYLGEGVKVSALSSGTSAIHLALIELGIVEDDIVLCSSFTFVASCNPILYLGAVPVFIDSEPDTWNMDPDLLEKAIIDLIKKGKKPKAIMLVYLYGMPAHIDRIVEISKKYEIPLVEDAAEALGAKYKEKALGTFGDFSIFSFNGNKIITGSCGGALVSTNNEKINHSRFLSTQARDPQPYFQHSEIGYNYRMSNICAGIVRGQLEVLNERVNKRREINEFYKKALSEISGISFLNECSPDFFSNHWLTCILVDPLKTNGVNHEDLRLFLCENNIESRHLWKPMHLQPLFKKAMMYSNGISEKLFGMGLCLPSGSNMTNEDLERIVNLIKQRISIN